MKMISVTSSNLVFVGYDESSKTLVIRFKSGVYEYYNVPKSIYNGLMSASSHGEYHAAHIKWNYQFNKIG